MKQGRVNSLLTEPRTVIEVGEDCWIDGRKKREDGPDRARILIGRGSGGLGALTLPERANPFYRPAQLTRVARQLQTDCSST